LTQVNFGDEFALGRDVASPGAPPAATDCGSDVPSAACIAAQRVVDAAQCAGARCGRSMRAPAGNVAGCIQGALAVPTLGQRAMAAVVGFVTAVVVAVGCVFNALL
jgi:hypothetical protein